MYQTSELIRSLKWGIKLGHVHKQYDKFNLLKSVLLQCSCGTRHVQMGGPEVNMGPDMLEKGCGSQSEADNFQKGGMRKNSKPFTSYIFQA